MREIKFRAWDTRKNGWFEQEGASICFPWAVPTPNRNHCAFGLVDTDLRWMQYTGLKDNKRTEEYPEGQDIYEGDVLKYSPDAKWTHTVEWGFQEAGEPADGNHAVFAGWDVPLSENREVDLEVIGNIYENPGLLKKGER